MNVVGHYVVREDTGAYWDFSYHESLQEDDDQNPNHHMQQHLQNKFVHQCLALLKYDRLQNDETLFCQELRPSSLIQMLKVW